MGGGLRKGSGLETERPGPPRSEWASHQPLLVVTQVTQDMESLGKRPNTIICGVPSSLHRTWILSAAKYWSLTAKLTSQMWRQLGQACLYHKGQPGLIREQVRGEWPGWSKGSGEGGGFGEHSRRRDLRAAGYRATLAVRRPSGMREQSILPAMTSPPHHPTRLSRRP